MLHDDGDAVRVGIECDMQLFVRQLSNRLVDPSFVRPKRTDGSIEHGLAHVHRIGRQELSPYDITHSTTPCLFPKVRSIKTGEYALMILCSGGG